MDVAVEDDARNRHIADVRLIVGDKKNEESQLDQCVREIEFMARSDNSGDSENESRIEEESEEEVNKGDSSSSDGKVRSAHSDDPPAGRVRFRPIRDRAPPEWLADFYVGHR